MKKEEEEEKVRLCLPFRACVKVLLPFPFLSFGGESLGEREGREGGGSGFYFVRRFVCVCVCILLHVPITCMIGLKEVFPFHSSLHAFGVSWGPSMVGCWVKRLG